MSVICTLIKGGNPHIIRVDDELRLRELELISQGLCHCRKCNQHLPLESFRKASHTHTGFSLYCKTCCHQDHYLPRKKDFVRSTRKWQKNNPEKVRVIRRLELQKPHNRIKRALTKTVKDYLRSKGILDTYRSLINCSPKQLVIHLESQFTPEMSWDNYGSYWHIDHIIPCAAFNWSIKSHIRWCWDHRNLRPLPGKENMAKSDSLPSGESVRELRTINKSKLTEIVGQLLEQMGIATRIEYAESWNSPSTQNRLL